MLGEVGGPLATHGLGEVLNALRLDLCDPTDTVDAWIVSLDVDRVDIGAPLCTRYGAGGLEKADASEQYMLVRIDAMEQRGFALLGERCELCDVPFVDIVGDHFPGVEGHSQGEQENQQSGDG